MQYWTHLMQSLSVGLLVKIMKNNRCVFCMIILAHLQFFKPSQYKMRHVNKNGVCSFFLQILVFDLANQAVLQGVGIAQSVYRQATGWMIGIRFTAGVRNYPLLYSVQTGSGCHPVSYRMGTVGDFPGGKAART
jgi:hypothetical protein